MKSLFLILALCISFVYSCPIPCPENAAKHNETHFMDLCIDCKMLIFSQLELHELLTVAETNTQLAYLAGDIFRQRIGSKHVKFASPFVSDAIEKYEVSIHNDYVMIQHYEMIVRILKNFGQFISSLEVTFKRYDSGTVELNNLINLHCGETLRALTITARKENFFDDFSRPFQAVENLTLDGEYTSFDGSDLEFGEIFPAMRNLFLGDLKLGDLSSLNRTYAQLEEVNVYLSHPDNEACFTTENIQAFIKKNPQIRRLNLIHATRSLLSFIGSALPNLEDLSLLWYVEDENDDEIRFDRLKSLSMKQGYFSLPANMRFEQLEELQTDAYPGNCDRWIEFVVSSNSLKILRVLGHHLNEQQIQRLATADSDLVEVTANISKLVQHKFIVEWINKLKQLQAFYVETILDDDSHLGSVMESLSEEFDKDWIIKETLTPQFHSKLQKITMLRNKMKNNLEE